MFDYVFMRIIKAEDIETLKAIDATIDANNFDMTQLQVTQLHIICGMQMQIFLLRERAELAEELVQKGQELRESTEELLKYISGNMGIVKVTVSPIDEDE